MKTEEAAINHKKGFLILAQNTPDTNYTRQARVLARSIHRSQSEPIGVSVVVDEDIPKGDDFDCVIKLSEDDAKLEKWKIHNKWRMWELSPYEKTLWLDSDMVVPVDISWWWDELDGIPIRFCTRPVDFQGMAIRREVYRKVWVEHKLPMVYTGMVYFDRSFTAERMFKTAKVVFREWPTVSKEFGIINQDVTGDLAFSLAVEILRDYRAVPEVDDFFKFVHMKPKAFKMPNSISSNWADSLSLIVDGNILIDGKIQKYPLHYVDKELVHIFDEHLRS